MSEQNTDINEQDTPGVDPATGLYNPVDEPPDPTDISRAAPDDPNRCQGVCSYGQCPNLAVLGGTVCRIHGGAGQQRSVERKSLRNYRIGIYQARLERFADSDIIKSLREEIGLLRILVETRFASCKTDMDLMLQSGPIADLIMKVEKTVTSCHSMEDKLKQVLDKQALIQFAGEVVGIVGEALPDAPDKIDTISNGILALIGRLSSEE